MVVVLFLSRDLIVSRLMGIGPIHNKDARFFYCGNSAADISKPHTFKWDPLADDVLEAA